MKYPKPTPKGLPNTKLLSRDSHFGFGTHFDLPRVLPVHTDGARPCPARRRVFFFSSSIRHTTSDRDWSDYVCSSDMVMT